MLQIAFGFLEKIADGRLAFRTPDPDGRRSLGR
jgi:hypothetical protein